MKNTANFYPLCIITVAVLLSLVSCKETVDNITYIIPDPGFDVDNELTINVVEPDGSELTGYDLEIDGPTSLSESGVAQSQFIFDNLLNGTYTITASADQYISGSVELGIQLPQDSAESYYNEITIVLKERTPPVTVNNSENSSVDTAPSDRLELNGETASFTFPAGIFPAGMEDEEGNVTFSITRFYPSGINNTFDEGTVQDFFDFDPDGFDLNGEATIEFPVAVPEELIGNDAEELAYIMQPGDIQVELADDGSGSNLQAGQVDFRRFIASANFNRFQRYAVIPNRRLTKSDGFTAYREVDRSGCGDPLTAAVNYETGVPGPAAMSLLRGRLTDRTITRTRQLQGMPGFRTVVEARNGTSTYTVADPNGQVLEESTVNTPLLNIRISITTCHDSGGG